MKNLVLILFLSFFFVSFSYAGGDDRDQVLPLNSLNDDDETPNFLKEDNSELALSDESEASAIAQPKLINQTTSEVSQNTNDIETISSVKSLAYKYLKSDQVILIMLILFFVGLILLFNFFVREKNN